MLTKCRTCSVLLVFVTDTDTRTSRKWCAKAPKLFLSDAIMSNRSSGVETVSTIDLPHHSKITAVLEVVACKNATTPSQYVERESPSFSSLIRRRVSVSPFRNAHRESKTHRRPRHDVGVPLRLRFLMKEVGFTPVFQRTRALCTSTNSMLP
jgi:hypothetical protein